MLSVSDTSRSSSAAWIDLEVSSDTDTDVQTLEVDRGCTVWQVLSFFQLIGLLRHSADSLLFPGLEESASARSKKGGQVGWCLCISMPFVYSKAFTCSVGFCSHFGHPWVLVTQSQTPISPPYTIYIIDCIGESTLKQLVARRYWLIFCHSNLRPCRSNVISVISRSNVISI